MIRAFLRLMLVAVLSALLTSGAFLGGSTAARLLLPSSPRADGGAPVDWQPSFPVFWEAWKYVHQDFYKPDIDDNGLVHGAVDGMVESLGDPHTLFIEPKTAAIEQSRLQGSFEGIGATIEMREGRLTIVAPIKGSPAEKAGLKTDDIILQVDDKIIQNMDITSAVSLIRGPKGTTVTLRIQRAKQSPFTVSIVRDVIRTPSVESQMIKDTTIAYIRLNQFSVTAPEEMQAELKTLLAEKPTGLIFDLRQNPGGLLSGAIDVASQFLKGGQTVVIIKDKNGNQVPCSDASGRPSDCKTRSGGVATDIPMVVLIDKGSASSSEIVAAALKDYKRATLIGVTTFGKGSVQLDHTLSDGSELNVTVAHFFSPKNNDINDVGISPDIEVKITDDDAAARRDAQLQRATEFLKNGK